MLPKRPPLSTLHDLPSKRRSPPSTPNLWLDHLPSPLCQQIATYLLSTLQHPRTTLLHLAESTPIQRDAVLSALSISTVHFRSLDSLSPWNAREPRDVILQRRWAALLRGRVSKLRTDGTCLRQMYLLPVVCGEGVTEAFLRAEDTLLRAAALSKSLRALRLWIEPHLDTALMLCSFRAMHALQRLELFCGIVEARLCPFGEAVWLRQLGEVMRTLPLRTLRVSCSCTVRKDRLWRLLPAVQSVTDVCVESAPPEYLMERVSRMEVVRVWNMHNAFDFVPKVFGILKELDIDLLIGGGVSQRELMTLVECERLEVLRLMLDREVTSGVDYVLRAMPRLWSLKLRWENEVTDRGKIELVNVTQRMLLAAVESASSLRELALIGVRVTLKDLEAMLANLGDRLLRLDVTLEGQEEQPLQRLAVLLVAAIKWNHELQFFQQARYLEDNCELIERGAKHQIELLLERLRQSAPRFSLARNPHII